MRCPSCGTDNNEPDSRFCGHCGGRMGTAQPRVAPTVKIADDASFPPRTSTAPPAAPAYPPPPQVSDPSIEILPRAVSRPPLAAPAAPPMAGTYAVAAPRPQAPAPAPSPVPPPRSLSQPPDGSGPRASAEVATRADRPSAKRIANPTAAPAPRAGRRWGLIVVLLIVDLGLAGAGAVLLQRGLAAPPPAPAQRAATEGERR